MQTKVSIIILTHNEEANIETCLKHTDQAEDLILLDSGSTDRTLEIAQSTRSDVRIFQHPFMDFADQRNWALDHTSPRHDWILFVDADEICTTALFDEISLFIQDPGHSVGAYIAGKNFFLGRWLRHATAYPSYQLRLLRLGRVRFEKAGHGQEEVAEGPLSYLKESWRHEPFSKGVHEWVERHNRYSSEEIARYLQLRSESIRVRDLLVRDPVRRHRSLKRLASKLPCRPMLRFIHLYIINRGFLDGYPGLLFCLLVYAQHIQLQVKIAEEQYEIRR